MTADRNFSWTKHHWMNETSPSELPLPLKPSMGHWVEQKKNQNKVIREVGGTFEITDRMDFLHGQNPEWRHNRKNPAMWKGSLIKYMLIPN